MNVELIEWWQKDRCLCSQSQRLSAIVEVSEGGAASKRVELWMERNQREVDLCLSLVGVR